MCLVFFQKKGLMSEEDRATGSLNFKRSAKLNDSVFNPIGILQISHDFKHEADQYQCAV